MAEHPDFAFRLKVDAGNNAFTVEIAEVNGDVDGHENEAANGFMGQSPAFGRRLNHQGDLLIGHERGIGVAGSD